MKIELPKVLLQGADGGDDYQVVETNEYGDDPDDAEYGGTEVQRGLTRRQLEGSPHRRYAEWGVAFMVGVLLTTLMSSATNNTTETTQLAEPPLSTPATSPVPSLPAPPVLSLEEREKFMHQAQNYKYDHSFFQQPKETPSGWWPDAEWIQACVDKPRELTPFHTLENWVDYRLGDCVKLCGGCPTVEDHPQLAHWTIAGQYYDLGCDPEGPQYHVKRGNETLLDTILEGLAGKKGFYKPDPEAIVIHLRLGDKMEDSKATVFEMLHNSADPGHRSFSGLHAIKSLYEFLTNIVTSQATKVVIRGGSQWPDMYQKSKTYAYCLQEAIEEAGYDVTINLDEGNADADFYFMVHARKMIVSVGGFSRYIGHLVLRGGGIVYGRVFRR